MDALVILMANSIFLLLLVIAMFVLLSVNKPKRRNAISQKADLKRIKEEVNEGNYL